MADFPTLSKGIDMATFSEEPSTDPSVQSGMDGGYKYSRPQFTRTPTMRYKFGFTDMLDADRNAIRNFWNARRGSSDAFNWTHPIDGTVKVVRFAKDMLPNYIWEGVGTTKRWGIKNIVVEEV